jgi:hypothetical protein
MCSRLRDEAKSGYILVSPRVLTLNSPLQHTVCYTKLSPTRFKDFWRDWLPRHSTPLRTRTFVPDYAICTPRRGNLDTVFRPDDDVS